MLRDSERARGFTTGILGKGGTADGAQSIPAVLWVSGEGGGASGGARGLLRGSCGGGQVGNLLHSSYLSEGAPGRVAGLVAGRVNSPDGILRQAALDR